MVWGSLIASLLNLIFDTTQTSIPAHKSIRLWGNIEIYNRKTGVVNKKATLRAVSNIETAPILASLGVERRIKLFGTGPIRSLTAFPTRRRFRERSSRKPTRTRSVLVTASPSALAPMFLLNPLQTTR